MTPPPAQGGGGYREPPSTSSWSVTICTALGSGFACISTLIGIEADSEERAVERAIAKVTADGFKVVRVDDVHRMRG